MILKPDDIVIWRGAWGTQAPKEAKVLRICCGKYSGDKYGLVVPGIPWCCVDDRVVVDLNNGHWAYGSQISPVTTEVGENV